MRLFVSSFTMRLDKKGRVSVPAPFRCALTEDGFQGLYVIPTPDRMALDAGGNMLMAQLEARLEGLDATSYEHELLATVFYGQSEVVNFDAEGRMMLSERLKALAGIEEEVVFVGKGRKFQMWTPHRYEAFLGEALGKAREALWGSKGPGAAS